MKTSDEIRDTSNGPGRNSGHDVDVWGDDSATQPNYVPRPGNGPCVLHVDGRCPTGCDACGRFLDDWLTERTVNGWNP